MKTYNYLESVKDSVVEYIKYNVDASNFVSREDLASDLHEKLFIEDSVTGNASGSFTFNSFEAEENVCHNFDLLSDALDEFGMSGNIAEKGAEWMDVTIRCHVLPQAIELALDELNITFSEDEE